MIKLYSILKSREITLSTKVRIVKAMVFLVVMYRCELDHKEGWVPKKWCFQTVVPEKILKSPVDSKETKPVSSKGNQPWRFIGRTDAEAPILWPPGAKTDSLKKTLMLEKIEGRRRKGQQRMRWLDGITDGHEFEQASGVGDGQGSLACCSPWHRRVGHDWVTELN